MASLATKYKPTADSEQKLDLVTWLLIGDYGTGKTHMLSTAQTPILVFQFDPGGTRIQPFRKLIAEGKAYVVDVSGHEDLKQPSNFKEFDKLFHQMKQDGFLKLFKTIAIDSLTTMADAVMNSITGTAGRGGTVPQIPDYWHLQQILKNTMRAVASQGADFVLTAHIGTDKDEITGRMTTALFVSGQSKEKLPLLFDEVYVLQSVTTGQTSKRIVMTEPAGIYKARTRIGGGGRFVAQETPDICALRAKAGLPVVHGAPLNFNIEEPKPTT